MRTTGRVAPHPMVERIKTRIEHLVDTRSARLGAGLLRLTKGRIARLWRRQVLVLTTRGRKSGKERTVHLRYPMPAPGESVFIEFYRDLRTITAPIAASDIPLVAAPRSNG